MSDLWCLIVRDIELSMTEPIEYTVADCFYLMSLMIFSLFGLAFSLLPRECDEGVALADCPKSAPPPPLP